MSAEARGPVAPEHAAQLYDDLAFLAARVADRFAAALAADGAAITMARPAHRDAIREALRLRGIDPDALAALGRLVLLDADELLATLIPGEALATARFRAVVGNVVRRVRATCGGPVHAYSELVDLLWGANRVRCALELEALWNELARDHEISVLCGYRLGAFAGHRHVDVFQELCGLHARVAPSESLDDRRFDAACARQFVELEQRARALESEVAYRNMIELRLEQLLDVTGALAGATRRQDIARIAVEHGLRAVGAAYGGMWALAPDAPALELLAVRELPRGDASAWTRIPLAIDAPITRVARTGEPVFLESHVEYQARFPASFERIRGATPEDIAYAMAPLRDGEKTVGVLVLAYPSARTIEGGERAFLSILARQCGLAFERVRIHEVERASREAAEQALEKERIARVEADEATRAREEILSVVSHDLRNPLGTILMGATMLQQLAPSDERGARLQTTAERIHRQAQRMARLIDDLVDFASIQAGRLAIVRAPCPPAQIIAQARELFGPLADERGLVLELTASSELPLVDCDGERAVQILANLVSNAIKLTPRGGRVRIGVTPEAGEVVFFVQDTGPGIEPDELARVFERFWRSKKSAYKGAGLGLSIARGLVDAHGGRIWATSEPGAGSTFYFSLARAS